MNEPTNLPLKTQHTCVKAMILKANEDGSANILAEKYAARNLAWHDNARTQLDDALFMCNPTSFREVRRTIQTPDDCICIRGFTEWVNIMWAVWSLDRYDDLNLIPNTDGGMDVTVGEHLIEGYEDVKDREDEAELMMRNAEAAKDGH